VFPGEGDEGLSYYAVAVARRNNPSVNFYTLKDKVACFPGEVLSVCFFSGIFLLRVNHMYANDNQLTDVGHYDSYPIGTRL